MFKENLNHQKKSEYKKAWYNKNLTEVKSKERNYRQSDRGISKRRNAYFKRAYNITLVDYNNLKESQNNSCATCLRNENILKKPLCVDHCHTTGKVRGLLCDDCNIALGKIRDEVTTLKNLISYLEKI